MKNALRRASLAALVIGSFLFSPIFLTSPAIPEAGAANLAISEEVVAPIPPALTAEVPKAAAPAKPKKIQIVREGLVPASVFIPSIDLETRVIPLGTNAKGEMDVPDGKTKDVGWYRYGTKPGEVGSAVLDAHVYAAFKELKDVRVGDSIYIESAKGEKLRFVVEEIQLKRLEDTSTSLLFARKDKARLNLITCAGTYIPSRGTYDKRLVVYAVLAP